MTLDLLSPPLLAPRMPSGDVRRPVQHVVPILQPVIPLPPCDGGVRLPAGAHGRQLRPKSALISPSDILGINMTFSHPVYICFVVCPAGYHGKQCSEVCINCANNSTCDHRDGHCECLPGWTATDCSIREYDRTRQLARCFYSEGENTLLHI